MGRYRSSGDDIAGGCRQSAGTTSMGDANRAMVTITGQGVDDRTKDNKQR